jgi:cell division protein FtsQ
LAISIASPTEVRSRLGTWVRILGAVVAAALLGAGLVALTHTRVFHVRAIEVDGNVRLHRPEIVRLSGLNERTNVIWFDEAAVRARLEQDPWIARADVSRSLSGTVQLHITERVPVAVVQRGTERTLVAGDGTILTADVGKNRLPRIVTPPSWLGVPTGFDVQGAARALASLAPDIRARVRRVAATPASALVLVLTGGMRISLGSPISLAAKSAAVDDVLSWAASTGERIRAIDVVAPSAPAVLLAG